MHDVRVDNATADKAESDADTIEMWDRTPRLIVVDNDNGGAGGASTLPANQAKMFSLEERDNRNVVLRSLANCSEFMRNRQIPILVATCSLLFTIGALLLGPPEMKSHYRWYLTPFLAVVVYFLCGLAEKLVSWAMQAIAACSSNAGWGLRVIVQELHGWLRIVVFCIVMSEVLLDEWMASLNVNVPREVQLAGKWIKSAYIILIIVVLKNVGLRVLERLFAEKSFGHRIHNCALGAFTLEHLCRQIGRSDQCPKSLSSRYLAFKRTHLMDRLAKIRDESLTLPLKQSLSGPWRYSETSRVEVSTKKEVTCHRLSLPMCC